VSPLLKECIKCSMLILMYLFSIKRIHESLPAQKSSFGLQISYLYAKYK
jgi:hypothetical protein